jgi:hypothetical protein
VDQLQPRADFARPQLDVAIFAAEQLGAKNWENCTAHFARLVELPDFRELPHGARELERVSCVVRDVLSIHELRGVGIVEGDARLDGGRELPCVRRVQVISETRLDSVENLGGELALVDIDLRIDAISAGARDARHCVHRVPVVAVRIVLIGRIVPTDCFDERRLRARRRRRS